MGNIIKYLLFICLTTEFIVSCISDDIEFKRNTFNSNIKSEVSDGKTISVYKYNESGKIEEAESFYFYQRFIYDESGKLVKHESAMDASLLSSSIPVAKTEMMTSKNSTISHFRLFKYNQAGKLIEIESYFKKSGEFVVTSKNSMEYEKGFLVRKNLHDNTGKITQYFTYEYDSKGNVNKEKYYSFLFSDNSQPMLINESSYKYDNKHNPFTIFKETGNPGLDTNPNNIIETNSVSYYDIPGIGRSSTSKTSYIYNSNDYPIKVITESGVWEYTY